MSTSLGPKKVRDSLVLNLDAANFKETPSISIANTINPFTVNYTVYNNPGFVVTSTKTNEVFRGAPVYRITYSPQGVSMVPRLGSTEGFGFYHGMGVNLLPNTPYMSSVYFRTNYPVNTATWSNTYSNIGGWGHSSTGSNRFQEGKWLRMYTRFLNNIVVDGVNYCTRDNYSAGNITVNTNAQTDILITLTFNTNRTITMTSPVGSVVIGTQESATIIGFRGAVPTINSTTVTGLSTGASAIVNHGLNTDTWTKMSTSNPVYYTSFPTNYYILIRVPSTSGVNQTINLAPVILQFNSSISDQKFWKITFNTSNLAVNDVIETFWAAPMIEQTDRLFPSPYTIGTKTTNFFSNTTWPNLVGPDTTLINGPLYRGDGGGSFLFDGVDDRADTGYDLSWNNTNSASVSLFVKPQTTSQRAGILGKNPHEWAIMQGTSSASTSALTFVYWDNTGNHTNGPVIQINNFFDTTNWVNITLTWSHIDSKTRIYKNGVLLDESTWSNPSINENRTGPVLIGGNIYSWNVGHWQGNISNIRFYNKTLTQEEVKQNFEALRKRFAI
jgi:hypothetical protein